MQIRPPGHEANFKFVPGKDALKFCFSEAAINLPPHPTLKSQSGFFQATSAMQRYLSVEFDIEFLTPLLLLAYIDSFKPELIGVRVIRK
jgi:hypothetical protein